MRTRRSRQPGEARHHHSAAGSDAKDYSDRQRPPKLLVGQISDSLDEPRGLDLTRGDLLLPIGFLELPGAND